MKTILTGASGLIGSRFEELMFEKHEIIPLKADITAKESIHTSLLGINADVMIHFAAKTDVDACEADKEEDQLCIKHEFGEQFAFEKMDWDDSKWIKKNSAFSVNFIGTRNLYEIAKEKGMKFVYISTDFVFNGTDKYDEESKPEPINWYGMTKWYGERLINIENDLVVRLSFPYGYQSPVKPDFVQKLIGLLREKDEVGLIEDQTITPTFIDDIVNGLDFLLQKDAGGIYHLSGSSYENPYGMGKKICSALGLKTKINATTRDKIYVGKAPRPFKSVLINDKLTSLGFKTKTFDEGLSLITS